AVLPREAAGGRYARVLRRRLPRGRDQQHVLPDAGAEDARLMGRADAAALPLRVEGAAADHAPIAPEGGRRADARVRATERGARREARSAALPASAQPEGRPRSARDVPRRAAVRPRARLRVPPRLLVPRRDLEPAARARRRPLPRADRRSRHATRGLCTAQRL